MGVVGVVKGRGLLGSGVWVWGVQKMEVGWKGGPRQWYRERVRKWARVRETLRWLSDMDCPSDVNGTMSVSLAMRLSAIPACDGARWGARIFPLRSGVGGWGRFASGAPFPRLSLLLHSHELLSLSVCLSYCLSLGITCFSLVSSLPSSPVSLPPCLPPSPPLCPHLLIPPIPHPWLISLMDGLSVGMVVGMVPEDLVGGAARRGGDDGTRRGGDGGGDDSGDGGEEDGREDGGDGGGDGGGEDGGDR